MFTIGQVVYSKSGRDKGLAFIVTASEDEYVYLADGRLRRLEKPKKKKHRHVQPTNTVLADIQAKLGAPAGLLNAEVRKALEPYQRALRKGNKEGVDDLV